MEEPTQLPQPPLLPPQATPAPAPPPRRGMSAGAKWAIGCGAFLALCLTALLLFVIAMMVRVVGGGAEYGALPGAKVALIRIEGTITASGYGEGLFGVSASSERVVAELQRAADDSSVKAIVLRINSPGGSAAGAQEIYQEVWRVRDRGKLVYASMGDVAASGGYYVACAAERIYANPGTITGSIGAISATLELSQLLEKIGVEPEVVKTGEFKDIGSGLRPMTERERSLIQGLLNDIYRQFVAAVARGRGMPEERVRKLADGRVFSGEQALQAKLVDELGNLRSAIRAAARRAGIRGRPRVEEYGKRSFMDFLLGDVRATPPPQMQPMRGLLYDYTADLLTRRALEAGR